MKKFYLVFGSIAIIALGSAAACTSDTGGSGGSGGGDGGSGTGTGGSATGTGTGTGTGMGGGGTGGGEACRGCNDYVSSDAEVAELCGTASVDEQAGTYECEAGDNSCSFLADLQACTCDPASCQTDCMDACTGGEPSTECLGCITNTCNTEFLNCTGDADGTGG